MGKIYRAAVVAQGGTITGIVGKDIAVVPDMSPKYTTDVLAAKASIAEVGGQLAHLATVSREIRKIMMVLPNACKVLTVGMRITMVPSRCEIRIHDD